MAQSHLEDAATIERSTVVLEVGVGECAPQSVAVDASTLAAEGLQGAVLREDAAMHVGCSVVLVQTTAQVGHLHQKAVVQGLGHDMLGVRKWGPVNVMLLRVCSAVSWDGGGLSYAEHSNVCC